MATKNPVKKRRISLLLQNSISNIYIIIFTVIFLTLLCFSWISYCSKSELFLPNIISLILILLISISAYYLSKKFKINIKHPRMALFTIFAIIYIIQIIIILFAFFQTGWDAGSVNIISDSIAETGYPPTTGSNSTYLSRYPNNIFLVTILSLIKSIPFLGDKYPFLLSINALLVNLAGIIGCFTIYRITSSKKLTFLTMIISIPLLLLNPWFLVPYSDTFSVIIPILILYLYSNKNKNWISYGVISFLGIIGYFIKPSSIIILIAILIVKIIRHKWHISDIHNKQTVKIGCSIAGGICLAFILNTCAANFIHFKQDPNVRPISSFVHYLAMGQNSESCGAYLEQDVIEANQGAQFELNKFATRFFSRTCNEQIDFFTKKLLQNYNDGTFAWSKEGNFYMAVPERDNTLSSLITNIYYKDGKYYQIFTNIEQMIWLLVLTGCVFLFGKHYKKNEIFVLQLSLIGLFIFVMIFEARARYLYTYVPFFIICSVLGLQNLKNLITKFIKKKKSNFKFFESPSRHPHS